jgi:hypothetical protein
MGIMDLYEEQAFVLNLSEFACCFYDEIPHNIDRMCTVRFDIRTNK